MICCCVIWMRNINKVWQKADLTAHKKKIAWVFESHIYWVVGNSILAHLLNNFFINYHSPVILNHHLFCCFLWISYQDMHDLDKKKNQTMLHIYKQKQNFTTKFDQIKTHLIYNIWYINTYNICWKFNIPNKCSYCPLNYNRRASAGENF